MSRLDSISNKVAHADTNIISNRTARSNTKTVIDVSPYSAHHFSLFPVVHHGRLGGWILFVGCASVNISGVREAFGSSRQRNSAVVGSDVPTRFALECHGGVAWVVHYSQCVPLLIGVGSRQC